MSNKSDKYQRFDVADYLVDLGRAQAMARRRDRPGIGPEDGAGRLATAATGGASGMLGASNESTGSMRSAAPVSSSVTTDIEAGAGSGAAARRGSRRRLIAPASAICWAKHSSSVAFI